MTTLFYTKDGETATPLNPDLAPSDVHPFGPLTPLKLVLVVRSLMTRTSNKACCLLNKNFIVTAMKPSVL